MISMKKKWPNHTYQLSIYDLLPWPCWLIDWDFVCDVIFPRVRPSINTLLRPPHVRTSNKRTRSVEWLFHLHTYLAHFLFPSLTVNMVSCKKSTVINTSKMVPIRLWKQRPPYHYYGCLLLKHFFLFVLLCI